MIILTAIQAQQVDGPTAEGAALHPVYHAPSDCYILPEAVLNDPAHAQHHAFLAGLPRADVVIVSDEND